MKNAQAKIQISDLLAEVAIALPTELSQTNLENIIHPSKFNFPGELVGLMASASESEVTVVRMLILLGDYFLISRLRFNIFSFLIN